MRRSPSLVAVQASARAGFAQVAACVNAVRQDPDGFACQYPCDYSQWRADVIYPVRGALVSSGTSGAQELDAYAC